MSSLNRITRLLTLSGGRQAMCVCAFLTTSCTYPSVLGRGDRSAAVEHSAASPRFSQGGPDAEEYGASEGYPIGDRPTCSRPVFLVGCHSHLDQVYEARLVRRATMASPLARGCDLAYRPLWARGCVLLHKRDTARLRTSGPIARQWRELARATDHSRGLD